MPTLGGPGTLGTPGSKETINNEDIFRGRNGPIYGSPTTGRNRGRAGGGVPRPGAAAGPGAGTGTGGAGGTGGGGGNVVNYNTQVPDYMSEMMNRLEGLWGQFQNQADQPLDFEGERAQIRKEQSQQRKEAGDIAGARGGEWGANLADQERGFAETRAGAEAGFTNREFDARQRALEALSSAMGMGLGLTGQMSGHELGMLSHLRDVSRIQMSEAELQDMMARWRAELDQRYEQMDNDRWFQEQQLSNMV